MHVKQKSTEHREDGSWRLSGVVPSTAEKTQSGGENSAQRLKGTQSPETGASGSVHSNAGKLAGPDGGSWSLSNQAPDSVRNDHSASVKLGAHGSTPARADDGRVGWVAVVGRIGSGDSTFVQRLADRTHRST